MDDIESFRLQLIQVEAALTTDPTNAELLKLKHDIEEIIVVTGSLQQNSDPSPAKNQPKSGKTDWKVGDKCQALYSGDGKYYSAKVDSISADKNTCKVTFIEYGNSEEVMVVSLREEKKAKVTATSGTTTDLSKADPSDLTPQQKAELREKKKAKKLKKKNRLLELEENRKKEQTAWQNFNKSASNKSKGGFMSGKPKKSIFASSVEGKVGVIGSGKPMTNFQQRVKSDAKTKLDAAALVAKE